MTRINSQRIPENIMSSMMQVENQIHSIGLDKKLMELMKLHVSQLNGCAYCMDMHFKEGIAAGEDAQRLYSLSTWRETDYFNEDEQALLAWSEAVTLIADSPGNLQTAFDGINKHFSMDEIVHLTLAIIQINSWNRLAKSFGFKAGSYKTGQY